MIWQLSHVRYDLECYDRTSFISQTRWTAFVSSSSIPITEALYDMILSPCTMRYDLMLVALVVGMIRSCLGVLV